MKINIKWLAIFAVAIISLIFSTSCTKPFVGACRELATDPEGEWQYTAEQSKAACAFANRILAGKYDKKGNMWSLDYTNVLKTEDVLKYVKDGLGSLDILLSYKHDGDARAIDFWKGFRESLEREEKIYRWVESRLTYVVNYNKFADKVGRTDSDFARKLMPYGRSAYSMRLIYPIYDLTRLQFSADYIESAKKNGSLKLTNEFPIIEKKKFAEKIVSSYDPIKFTWKEYKRGWLIKAYKILPTGEKPASADIDYLEVYKAKFHVDATGKEYPSFETHFAISGFKSSESDTVNIFVVDYDYNKISGFSPDEVCEIFTKVVNGNELYVDNTLKKQLLVTLYDPPIGREKEYRKKPPIKPLYVEVAKMGEVSGVQLWEASEKGFSVPYEYPKFGPGKFFVSTEIMWRKPRTLEEKEAENLRGLKQMLGLKVSYKKGSYAGNAKVIEYYLLKPKYTKRNVSSAFAGLETLTVNLKGFPEEKSEIGYFSERVKYIDYEYGQVWFRIKDEDGDGKFEKRSKVANPNTKKVSYGYKNRGGL